MTKQRKKKAAPQAEQPASTEPAEPEIMTMADIFAVEYLFDFNATAAAIRAGYSAETARQQGARLLTNVDIIAKIEAAQQEYVMRRRKDVERLRQRLEDEVDADLADIFDEKTGALKNVHQWPMAFRRGLVVGIEVDEIYGEKPDGGGAAPVIGHTKKVKIADRHKRVELLGKHRDIFAWREKKDREIDAQDNPLKRWREEVSGRRILPKPGAGNPQKV